MRGDNSQKPLSEKFSDLRKKEKLVRADVKGLPKHVRNLIAYMKPKEKQ